MLVHFNYTNRQRTQQAIAHTSFYVCAFIVDTRYQQQYSFIFWSFELCIIISVITLFVKCCVVELFLYI